MEASSEGSLLSLAIIFVVAFWFVKYIQKGVSHDGDKDKLAL